MKEEDLSVVALFTATATLICCALPAFLVSVGMAAVVISAVATFPWLIPLTQHKAWLFLGAGALLGLNCYLMYRPNRQVACDVPAGSSGCEVSGRWNRVVRWLSTGIYAAGLFMAYLALPILEVVEN